MRTLYAEWGDMVFPSDSEIPDDIETPAVPASQLRVGELYFEAAERLACDDLTAQVSLAPNGTEMLMAYCGEQGSGPFYYRFGDFVVDALPDMKTAEGVEAMLPALAEATATDHGGISFAGDSFSFEVNEQSLPMPTGTVCEAWALVMNPHSMLAPCIDPHEHPYQWSDVNVANLGVAVEDLFKQGVALGGLTGDTVGIRWELSEERHLIMAADTKFPPTVIGYELDGVTPYIPPWPR